jgi:hypothetical protein
MEFGHLLGDEGCSRLFKFQERLLVTLRPIKSGAQDVEFFEI